MMDPHENLRMLFRRHHDQPFLFVVPGGNWGDHLIWRGAEKIAQQEQVAFQSMGLKEFLGSSHPQYRAIYVHGAGGFNPWWGNASELALRHACATEGVRVIQGPQTALPDRAYLERALAGIRSAPAAELRVLVREQSSFDAMRDLLDGDQLALCHDTALALAAADFPHIQELMEKRRDYDLVAIREDAEANRVPGALSIDPVRVTKTLDHWLALHACARSIVTNRLHSAIAGSMFGVPTTLFANSYHKNRSVWEYSLRARGVAWGESIPEDRGVRASLAALTGKVSPRLRRKLVRRFLRVLPAQLGLGQ